MKNLNENERHFGRDQRISSKDDFKIQFPNNLINDKEEDIEENKNTNINTNKNSNINININIEPIIPKNI